MSKTVKYILYVVGAYIAIYFIIRLMNKNKYLSFLKGELGMNIADKFSLDELKTSYIYLHDYARKFSTNASSILKATNLPLWNKAKLISDKYKIFNL